MPVVRNRKTPEAACPVCRTTLYFSRRPGCGQFLTCHECDSKLIVRRRSPIVLALAFVAPLGVSQFGNWRADRHLDDWDYEGYAGGGEYCDRGRAERWLPDLGGM